MRSLARSATARTRTDAVSDCSDGAALDFQLQTATRSKICRSSSWKMTTIMIKKIAKNPWKIHAVNWRSNWRAIR